MGGWVGGGGGGGGRVRGCQGGWERRIEAFVKIKKKKFFFLGGGGGGGVGRVRGGSDRGGGGGGGGGGGSGWGCQGGWEWRIEAFVKIQKKNLFFWGGGTGWM